MSHSSGTGLAVVHNNGQARMPALPIEIIERITDSCWARDAYSSDGEIITPSDVRAERARDSLGIRSVCRELTTKTFRSFVKAFFSDLTVILDLASLQRLVHVANHPEFSTVVRTITVGPHLLPLPEEITYDRVLELFENPAMEKPLQKKFDRRLDWNTDFLAKTKDTALKFRAAVNRQAALSENNLDVAMLAAAMSRLPGLRTLEVADSRRKTTGHRDDPSLSHWGLRNLAQDLNIRNAASMTSLHDGNLGAVSKKVISALAEPSCRQTRANLTSLRLIRPIHGSENLAEAPPSLPMQELDMNPILDCSNLRHLQLDVQGYLDREDLEQVERDKVRALHACSLIPIECDNLEVLFLRISDKMSWREDNIESMAQKLFRRMCPGHRTYPHLRQLRLTGAFAVKMKHLEAFVKAHSLTLDSIRLELHEPYTGVNFADGLLREATKCSRLESFTLKTYHQFAGVDDRDLDADRDEDVDGNYDFDWQTSSEVKEGLAHMLEGHEA